MTGVAGYRQRLGRRGEDMAAQYLAAAGCAILARNCRTPYGEIDLLVRDRTETVLVEVKTRRRRSCGDAVEAVDRRKRERLRRLAAYLGLSDALVRFDVLAIDFAGGHAQIEWVKGAF